MKDSIPAFEAIHTWLTEQGVVDEGDDVLQPALSGYSVPQWLDHRPHQ